VPGSPFVEVSGIQSVTATANGAAGNVSFCQFTDVNFDAQVQQMNCGSLTYAWNFSDGDSSTFQSPTHRFRGGPPYSATVTVTCSQSGCTNSTSSSVTVSFGQALNSVDAKGDGQDSVTVYAGQPVHFTAITDPPNMVDAIYTWDFGDGTKANGASAFHSFSQDETVRLTVACGNGPAVTDTVDVHVTTPPFPPIEADIVDEPPTGSTFASGIDQSSIVLKLNGNRVTPSIAPIQNGFHIYYVPSANEVHSGPNLVELEGSDNAVGDGTVGNQTSDSWPYVLP
jgi:hypothetical protein